jgi:imidazolonepropionase-like amidohydrolase
MALLATAQPVNDDLPQITGCIALINAKVVSGQGKTPVTNTIIIRDGLITAMGASIKIPPDAYRIAADSLYAYPAFIDAISYDGIKEPEEGNRNQQGGGNRGQKQEIDDEGNPNLEDAGITPFNGIRSTFDPKDKSIADWRAQGFSIAHIVPRGKMIPGKGSIIVLSGKETDQVLWKENMSMYAQWNGAGGSYPSTVIGVMAKWRELYHNASQYVTHETSYETASLVSRPNYNQAHIALMPVVKKEMPVYFRAPKVKDISRALAMQKDLGMKMVIADAEEAWYLKDQFKSNGIPLILSLDLPEDKGEKADASAEKATASKEGAKEAKGAEVTKDTTNLKSPIGDLGAKPDTLKVDPEKEAFEKRRAESLKAHYEQAGVLAKGGIAFSFGTLNTKPNDFSKNIQTIMENGLTFDQTLSALTTQPAKLLGIEKYCGTVEVGKMANIIMTNKPLFEKETAIRYMMVEGNLYEYDVKEKKKPKVGKESTGSFSVLVGTWNYSIESPDGKREGNFEFTQDSSELKGTITGEDITSGNEELEGIVLDGNTVSFTFDFDMGGQIMALEFDLKIDGESLQGTVTVGEFGTFPVTGQRTSKPN